MMLAPAGLVGGMSDEEIGGHSTVAVGRGRDGGEGGKMKSHFTMRPVLLLGGVPG